jgi:large subunit ribosomal protein L25
LDFNDNVRWHDLKGTENVKPVIDRDFVVATVVPPTKIEVVAETATAGAPTAAAAAPAKGGSRAPGKAPAKKG